MVELRKMLQNEQLEELNVILDENQNLFEKDPRNEYKVHDAYRAFDLTVPSYEDFFKKWINTSPDKYQPYLAIAQYYYARGWENRGYKWAKDTPEKQFEGMQFYFSKAEQNLKVALNINPNLIVAYHILIGIYNANGDDTAEDRIIGKAGALFPHSFLINSDSLWAKEPRWGGSYVTMEEIAKKSAEDHNILLIPISVYARMLLLAKQNKINELVLATIFNEIGELTKDKLRTIIDKCAKEHGV